MTSDLQSLIHTNAMNAFRQGVQSERSRVIGLLNTLAAQQRAVIDHNPKRGDNKNREMVIATAYQIAALIQEQK